MLLSDIRILLCKISDTHASRPGIRFTSKSTSITGTVVVWHLDPDPMPETVKPNVHRPTISLDGRFFLGWEQ